MRITALLVIAITSIAFLHSRSVAQVDSSVDTQLEVAGAIVAYDGFVAATNTTFAPRQQILIVRVDKVLKGFEISRYLKVVYEYFQSDDELVKALLSARKESLTFVLSRDARCDSTLAEMMFIELEALDGTYIGKQRKLKDLDGLDQIPEYTKLPCYNLTSYTKRKLLNAKGVVQG